MQLECGLWQLLSCCEKVNESPATLYKTVRSAARELAIKALHAALTVFGALTSGAEAGELLDS